MPTHTPPPPPQLTPQWAVDTQTSWSERDSDLFAVISTPPHWGFWRHRKAHGLKECSVPGIELSVALSSQSQFFFCSRRINNKTSSISVTFILNVEKQQPSLALVKSELSRVKSEDFSQHFTLVYYHQKCNVLFDFIFFFLKLHLQNIDMAICHCPSSCDMRSDALVPKIHILINKIRCFK